ncbi:hypothetical protein HYR99_35350, partial [Candidatus Poribacteria bacterium]|nr:hypothetical protein [Candidatus Poribacteria bacterium]
KKKKNGRTKAQQIWDEVLQKFPGGRDIHSEMAYQWATLGLNTPALLSVYAKLGVVLPEASDMYTRANVRRYPDFTRQLGYVYLQLGIHERDMRQRNQYLTDAIDHLDKNRPAVDYRFDDPLLLVYLAQGYYHKRNFKESARIWQNFSREYPEVIQIFESLQIISEIAGVWPLGQMPNPQWMNMNECVW